MRLSHVLLEPEAGAQIRALPPRARLSGGLGLEARQAARGRCLLRLAGWQEPCHLRDPFSGPLKLCLSSRSFNPQLVAQLFIFF